VGVTANFSQVSNGIPLGVNISWGANATVGNLWSTNSSSFVIAGGSTLTLAVDGVTQTIPTINVGSSSSECWIKGGYLAGTNGFLKTGANKLTFRYDANTNAGLFGPVVIGQGSLGFQVDGNLGDPHNSLTFSNGITFTLESGTTGAAVTLFIASAMGVPVSTTHTITGAIVGVGSLRRLSAVKWGVAGRIVWAWIITIPCSGAIAAMAFWLVHRWGH